MKNSVVLSFLLCLICLFMISCGGLSTTESLPVNGVNIGTLPTGSNVYISVNPINIINLESATAILSLNGGQPGLTYTFTFNESHDAPVASPTSCTLVTGSTSSCDLTFLSNFASNGSYTINVNYALVASSTTVSQTQYMATNTSLAQPITLIVSGTTQAKMVLPSNLQGVGVGTPIIIEFNNQIESNTVNSDTFKLVSQSGESVSAESIIVLPDNKSATFIVTSSYQNALNTNTQYTVLVTKGIIDIFNNPIVEADFNFTTQAESYIVFLTESYFNGNLLGAANTLNPQGNYTNGIAAADYLCQRDANRPNNSNYKAMIVDDTGQYRSAYPVPVDWVFMPYSSYVNAQESPMFITGINPSVSINPYNNAVSPVTFNSYALNKLKSGFGAFLTGMAQNWTTIVNSTCQSWTSAESTSNFSYGYSTANIVVAESPYVSAVDVFTGNSVCSQNGAIIIGKMYLLCVEQPF